MQTRLLAAAISLAAFGAACAPEPGTCADGADCAFGQTCSVDGRCVIATGAGQRFVQDDGLGVAADDPAADGWVGPATSVITTTGRFGGHIGNAEVDVAEVAIEFYDSPTVVAWFKKPGATSTFVLIKSPEDFRTPGTRTLETNFDETAQACNYDTATYDEFFPSFEVEVSPPREVTPEDDIIAEDLGTTVSDVTVTVAGEGSDVVIDFVMPVE